MQKVRDRVQLLRKESKVEVPEMEASKEIAPPSLEITSGLENGSDATAALSPSIPEQIQSKESPSSRKRQIEGMPSELQDQLETVMQQDFSSVKIHPNSSLASQMGALAFARGNEVHFAPGQYQPQTPQGRQLIGHEFAHLVQQRQQQVKANTSVEGMPVNDDPALEAAADAMGARVAEMGNSKPGGLSTVALEGAASEVMQMKVENIAPEAVPTEQAEAPLAQESEQQDSNTTSTNEADKAAEADETEASPESSKEAAANEQKQAEDENPELDALIAEQDGQAVEDEVVEQEAATAEGDAAQLAPDPGTGGKGFDWGNLTYMLAPTLTLPGLAIEKLSAAASAKLEKTSAPDWLKTGVKTLGNVQGSINQAIHQYGGELIEGAVMGDFKEDPTAMNMIGQVLVGLIPVVGQAADLRDTIHAIGKMTNGGWKEGGNWLNLGLTLLAWVPLLGDGVKVLSKLGKLKGVQNLLTKLEPVGKAISETWGKVTKYLAPKIDAFKQFLSKGWNDLKTAATKKFNAAKEKVMAAVSKVKSGISSAWNWVKGKVSAGVDWVKGKFSAAWDKAKSMVASGTQKLKDNIAKAAKSIQQKAAALPQKLLDKTKAIWEGVKSGVNTVKSKVKSSLNGIKAKFERFVGRVRQKWDDWRGKGKDQGADGKPKDKEQPEKKSADADKKAVELPAAIAAAKSITATNERVGTPAMTLISMLKSALMPRFKWIKDFVAKLKAPGHHQVAMIASWHEIDDDYDPNPDPEGSAALIPQVQSLVDKVPAKYKKIFKCKEFAADLKKRMKAQNITGEHLQVRSRTERIWSDKYNGLISENGIHEAIKAGDMVFDNLNPKGIPYAEWIKDLGIDSAPKGIMQNGLLPW